MLMIQRLLLALLYLPVMVSSCLADEARVAVASNFLHPARELVTAFEKQGKHRIELSSGSTGKLYAQILHGAPYDVFLAADAKRPAALEASSHAVSTSRFTYAIGKVALWAPADKNNTCFNLIKSGQFKRLAIANPKTAPYGYAAKEILTRHELWNKYSRKVIRGENIAQTFQYLISGNADVGFIALSQLKALKEPGGCIWEPASSDYSSIEQQAVLLKKSKDNPAAQAFISYLHSPSAKTLIRSLGYDTK